MKKLALLALAAMPLMAMIGCDNNKKAQDGWQLVWEDNFDSGDSFDTTVWSKIPRGRVDWNNYMSSADSLYAISDGKLVLRGTVNHDLANDTAPYITAGIYTKDKKGFNHGRIEVSAKFNDVKGAWPAIWLMPQHRTQNWPLCGEIDIMERLNSDSIAYQTVHSNYTVNHGIKDNPVSGVTGPINMGQFNTYAVELYADSIVFFINDLKTNTYPRIETDIEGQFPFDQEWYLMLDMQLGGNWVGEVDPADLPAVMEIDWVKYYQKPSEITDLTDQQ